MKHFARLISILIFLPTMVCAASVDLAWNASASNSVTGYRIHYGSASGSYSVSQDVGNKLVGTLATLTAGQHYFIAVTAYDAAGNTSLYSNEIQYIPPLAPILPAAVTNLRVVPRP